MNCSPLGSSVHGILQARILEWLVVPSSRGDNRIAANIPTRTMLCASHALTHWIPHTPFVVYNRLKICDREIIQSTNDKRKLGSVKVWADAPQPGAWPIGTARLSSVSTRARGKRQGTQGKWDLIKKLKVGYYFVDLESNWQWNKGGNNLECLDISGEGDSLMGWHGNCSAWQLPASSPTVGAAVGSRQTVQTGPQ